MGNVYVIGSVVIAIIGLFAVIKYVRSQGKLNTQLADKIEDGTSKAIHIVEAFLNVADLGSAEKSIQSILDIADSVSEYVADILDESDDKTSVSLAAIDKILKVLDVQPSESEQNLIQIVVDESIKFVEKQNK